MAVTFELVTHTISLTFAAGNIALLLLILTEITSVAESPRAWTFLTIGLSMLIINFSIEVFMWANAMFDVFVIKLLAAAISTTGFLLLMLGAYNVWRVIEG